VNHLNKKNTKNKKDVQIKSYIYGTNEENTTLHLQINKDNIDFIHLTIHLAPEWLTSGENDNGIIHIYKDIYEKYVSKRKRNLIYAIYHIEHPVNKPHSLHFNITHGYSTILHKDATKDFNSAVTTYDTEIQQEMDVITNVLNKIFDEDNINYYIGDYHKNTLLLLIIQLHKNLLY
jgi:hypothetical protein